MKQALVCGASGFIGSHIVKRLKSEGFWVRGVDLKFPEFSETAQTILSLAICAIRICAPQSSTVNSTRSIKWLRTWVAPVTFSPLEHRYYAS